jgi:hypothetical protein
VVGREGKTDPIVLLELFVRLNVAENPRLVGVNHANLHGMEDVGLEEVTHDTGTMSKLVESSVHIVLQSFGIGCLGVGIAERSI